MKTVSAAVAICILRTVCFAQQECSVAKLRADTESASALDRIVAVVGIDPSSILLYKSSEAAMRAKRGAMSVECPGGMGMERWIVYDPSFIEGSSARDFMLAHELAHLTNYHNSHGGNWNRDQELQADYYAAIYLTRLHWTKDQLLQSLDDLKLPMSSEHGYPTLEERRGSVLKAYADATRPPSSTLDNLYSRGETLYKSGDYQSAIEVFDQALKQRPNWAEAYNLRGASHDALNQLDLAFRNYDQAVKLSPNWSSPIFYRGRISERRGQLSAAAADFTEACKLSPDWHDACLARDRLLKSRESQR